MAHIWNAIAAEIAPPGPGSRSSAPGLRVRSSASGPPRPVLSARSSVLPRPGRFLLLSHEKVDARRSWTVVYMRVYTTVHDHARQLMVGLAEPGGGARWGWMKRVGAEDGRAGTRADREQAPWRTGSGP